MKRFAAAVLALLLAVCGMAAAGEARRVENAGDADDFAAALLGEHPEEMEGRWALSPQMEAAIGQMGGFAGMVKQLSALGTPESRRSAYAGEVNGMTAFYIPCTFSAMQRDLVLVTEDGAIAGLWTGPYSGEREKTDGDDEWDSTELSLKAANLGELPGTLCVPKGEGPFPAVVLLQGSGASDRDETIGRLRPFRDLAEGLARSGVAVYRFDKRTYVYGARIAADKQFTPADEYIEDALNAVKLLAEQNRIDPERIWVLGHSLGGNMIPAIAREMRKEAAGARGFILMAASPRPMDVLMREQYEFLYSLLPELTEKQQAEKEAAFRELDLLRDPGALGEEDRVAGAYSAYWKWLADYDILQAADEMAQPVLLLQGEEDYQVTMTDFGIWKEAFGTKENWQLVSCPGLTHAFTRGLKTEGSAVYARADQMDAGMIEDIAAFILRDGMKP